MRDDVDDVFEGITADILRKKTNEAIAKNIRESKMKFEMDDKISTDKALDFIEDKIMPYLKDQLNKPSAFNFVEINIKYEYSPMFNKVFLMLKSKGFYPSLAYRLEEQCGAISPEFGERVLRIKW